MAVAAIDALPSHEGYPDLYPCGIAPTRPSGCDLPGGQTSGSAAHHQITTKAWSERSATRQAMHLLPGQPDRTHGRFLKPGESDDPEGGLPSKREVGTVQRQGCQAGVTGRPAVHDGERSSHLDRHWRGGDRAPDQATGSSRRRSTLIRSSARNPVLQVGEG
jgi:hypothetical protein